MNNLTGQVKLWIEILTGITLDMEQENACINNEALTKYNVTATKQICKIIKQYQ